MPVLKTKPILKKSKSSRLLPLSVAVLMGGESKRFGSPKAFLAYKRKSLAAHVLGQAARYSKEVFAVSRTEDQVPPDARKKFKVITDRWDQSGPLAGLHGALEAATQSALFLCGVDMPFLNRKVLAAFCKWFKADPGLDVIAPKIQDRWEPLCALWSPRVLRQFRPGRWKSFQQLLNDSKLRVLEVSEKEMRELDPHLECLRNFNTPQEWAQAFKRKANPQFLPR